MLSGYPDYHLPFRDRRHTRHLAAYHNQKPLRRVLDSRQMSMLELYGAAAQFKLVA